MIRCFWHPSDDRYSDRHAGEDMKRIIEQKNLFCLPWTQTILGTHLEGRINFMALDWVTRVNYNPPMLLTMPDDRFWAIGECVGKAWNAGKKFRKRLQQEKKE